MAFLLTKAVPEEVNQRFCEKTDSLIVAIVFKYFEKTRPQLIHERLHNFLTRRNKLPLDHDAMRVNEQQDY